MSKQITVTGIYLSYSACSERQHRHLSILLGLRPELDPRAYGDLLQRDLQREDSLHSVSPKHSKVNILILISLEDKHYSTQLEL